MQKPHGLILAGGLGRRLGGVEKALVHLGETTLLCHVETRVAPQCHTLAISANGAPGMYKAGHLPVLKDTIPDRPGPLAGILAGLYWTREHGGEVLFVAPVDTPFLPKDIVEQLCARRASFAIASSTFGGERRAQPVVGLWPVALIETIETALLAGERRVGQFAQTHGAHSVEIEGEDERDPFFNINTADDLLAAQALLRD